MNQKNYARNKKRKNTMSKKMKYVVYREIISSSYKTVLLGSGIKDFDLYATETISCVLYSKPFSYIYSGAQSI